MESCNLGWNLLNTGRRIRNTKSTTMDRFDNHPSHFPQLTRSYRYETTYSRAYAFS